MPPVPTTRCPACGTPSAAAERFCRSCGNDRAAPAGLAWPADDQVERTEVMADRGLADLRAIDAPDADARAGNALWGGAPGGPLPGDRESRAVGAPPAPPPGRARPGVPRPGRPLAGGLVIALGVLLLVIGMVGSWAIIAGKITAPASGASAPSGTAPPSGRPSPTSTSSRPAGTASPAPGDVPGDVEVAPALRDRPDTPAAVRLLSAYFTAIDQRDFAALQRTEVARPGLPQTETEFRRRYKSTQDSQVRLLGLRSGPDGGLVASVSFVSRQDPADSPDGVSSCLRWSISYPLVPVDGVLRIDAVGQSGVVRVPC